MEAAQSTNLQIDTLNEARVHTERRSMARPVDRCDIGTRNSHTPLGVEAAMHRNRVEGNADRTGEHGPPPTSTGC